MEEKISAIRDELSALKGLVNGLNEKISSIESLLTSLAEENSLPEFEVEPESEAVPGSGQELELDEMLFEPEPVFEPVQETVPENKSEGRKTLPENQEDDGMPVFMLYDYDWMKDRPGLPVNDMRSAVTLNDRVEFINSLFDGDHDKVKALDKFVCNEFGFKSSIPVSGQTYTRKIDYNILVNLSMLAQSAYKFAQDIRLLQSRKEMEEPFSEKQIGSSAMAYKRNPMRSERICALSRYIVSLPANAAMTSSITHPAPPSKLCISFIHKGFFISNILNKRNPAKIHHPLK